MLHPFKPIIKSFEVLFFSKFLSIAVISFSNQFWSSCSVNCRFSASNSQKSEGAKSGEYGGWRIIMNPLLFKWLLKFFATWEINNWIKTILNITTTVNSISFVQKVYKTRPFDLKKILTIILGLNWLRRTIVFGYSPFANHSALDCLRRICLKKYMTHHQLLHHIIAIFLLWTFSNFHYMLRPVSLFLF